jgi:hypothetical protein
VSATEYTAEDRRARSAARTILVLEWMKSHADQAIAALRIVLAEKGASLSALDLACHEIDEAQAKTIEAIANLRSSR